MEENDNDPTHKNKAKKNLSDKGYKRYPLKKYNIRILSQTKAVISHGEKTLADLILRPETIIIKHRIRTYIKNID